MLLLALEWRVGTNDGVEVATADVLNGPRLVELLWGDQRQLDPVCQN